MKQIIDSFQWILLFGFDVVWIFAFWCQGTFYIGFFIKKKNKLEKKEERKEKEQGKNLKFWDFSILWIECRVSSCVSTESTESSNSEALKRTLILDIFDAYF